MRSPHYAFLEILDQRSLKNPLPACVADVYDQEEYRKWRAYKGERKRMSVISSVINYPIRCARRGYLWISKNKKRIAKQIEVQMTPCEPKVDGVSVEP